MTDELATAPAAPVADTSAQPAAQATGGAAPAETNPGETSNPHDAGAVGEPSADTAIAKHPYNVEEFGRLLGPGGDGAADLHSFASTMAQTDAPQASVHAMLGWYEKVQAGRATWADLDALNEAPETVADALQWFAGRAMTAPWTPSATELQQAKAYVRRLPAGIREALTVVGRDGKAPGNDPRVVSFFTKLAIETAKLPAAQPAGGAPQGRADDPGAQPMPKASASVDAEIAAIEKRMRTDLAGYRKDEAMQRRYRELLQARGG